MAVFRVERNTGYTVMSNHHLRNKELSLKAKGLLSQMLSLPEDWDYTLAGLSYINRGSIDAIRTAVWELVDILEEECENIDSSKKEMSLHNFEIEHEKIANEPKTVVEKKEENDSSNIDVSGKIVSIMPKISVFVKKPCTVINAPCEHYIPKKSRELLKEDSCRNLIQYVKRNKPNGRVECSISGLPGYIGVNWGELVLSNVNFI